MTGSRTESDRVDETPQDSPGATVSGNDSAATWDDPVALAEVCLGVALARDIERVRLIVLGERSFLSLERAGFEEPLGVISRELGEATIFRLMLLGADRAEPTAGSLGRVVLRMGRSDGEIIVRVSSGSDGLELELTRVRGGTEPWVPRPGPVLPPTQLGAYTVLEEIGRGGAGVVYRALHDALESVAAVKVLDERYEGRAEASARFLREARAASRLDHPGVVKVFDFGMAPDGRPYMVMELITEPTLRQALDSSSAGALPPARVCAVGAAIAEVLSVAHRAGIIHCDIKPENVFVLAGDRIKIVDFGAAQLHGRDRRWLRLVGTPRYMAPELFRAESATPASDLYALGCLLYELATSEPPYEPADVIEMARAHGREPMPTPRSPHGPLPEALARVLERCLAKDPHDRPESADWVQRELEGER